MRNPIVLNIDFMILSKKSINTTIFEEEAMKAKKIVRGILIALVILLLLIIIFIVWVMPRNLGPIEPFLNLGDIFTDEDGILGALLSGGDGETPGKPAYYQKLYDCSTGELVSPGELIQPGIGCDEWAVNRYERPFNAVSQDEYYPDLDIEYAFLGRDVEWYFLRFALFDPQPGTDFLAGTYAVEMDLEGDGRGDLLVLVSEPGKEAGNKWSTQGVQIWADSNDDVGAMKPNAPESDVPADGYDTLLFDQGSGDDPNGAWARAFMSGSAYVELAFKTHYLGEAFAFKWWVWSSYGSYSPDMFELHDFYSHEQTGDTYEGKAFFPAKEVFAIDSTCAKMWGASPNQADPDFCSIENEPEYKKCCLLKLFRCRIPFDIPGDDPCVLAYGDWVILVWQPEHPGETPTNGEKLLFEWLEYLMDPYCPPEGVEIIEPTHTTEPTATFTTEPTATFTLEPTATFTPIPTDTSTPTPTRYIPPPPKCAKKYGKTKCEEVGGTYHPGSVPAPGGPPSEGWCECP
jgi:hypothetical protein